MDGYCLQQSPNEICSDNWNQMHCYNMDNSGICISKLFNVYHLQQVQLVLNVTHTDIVKNRQRNPI